MNRMNQITRPALGFSIIELMVAITVSMILLAGVISIFVSNKQTYTITDNMSRLQENARFAMDFMSRDLRMAGYFGCMDDSSTITNSLYTGGRLWDVSNPLEGVDNNAVAWSPSGRTTPGTRTVGTDAVTIRYLMGQGSTVTTSTTSTQATIASVNSLITELGLSTSADLVNTLMGITDCKRGNIFQVSAVAGNTLSFTGANSSLSPGYAFDAISNTPAVYPLRAVRYFIGQNSSDAANNSLYRREVQYPTGAAALATADNELVESVEDMQILYGIDSNRNGVPNNYFTAGSGALSTANHWATVVSLRIGLLMRTTDTYGTDPDINIYNLFNGHNGCDPLDPQCRYPCTQTGCVPGSVGAVDPADLNVRRRVFTTTVHLRNR